MNTEGVKVRIGIALDAAKDMGVITKDSTIEELMSKEYDILIYEFDYTEILILSDAVIEKVFTEWLKK